MKNKFTVMTILVFLVFSLTACAWFDSGLQVSNIDSITLTYTGGLLKLDEAHWQAFADVYNDAEWSKELSEQIGPVENGLEADVLTLDGKSFPLRLYDDPQNGILLYSAEKGIAKLASADVSLQTLLSDEVLMGEDYKSITTTLYLSGDLGEQQLKCKDYTLAYRDLSKKAAEKKIVGDFQDARAQFSASEPGAKVSLKLDQVLKIDTVEVTAVLDGEKIVLPVDAGYQFELLPDMGIIDYIVNIKSKENDLGIYTATAELTYAFTVDQNYDPQVEVLDDEQTLGGFFLIRGRYFDEATTLLVEQSIVDIDILPYRDGNEILAVIPLNYHAALGEHDVVLYAVKDDQKTELLRARLTVNDRDFDMQNLTISPSKEREKRSDQAYAQYHERFMPVRETSQPEQLWDGQFIMPLEGRQTTDYGARRKVNDALTRYRHNGVDIAAPRGTEIKASNSGKIVFSEELTLTGNTVIIDHGLGFFTYYLHMDERRVEVDDAVEKGQVIGTVGSTGFATGPHLHFTASYHLKNINPYVLLEWNGEWRDWSVDTEQ